MVAQQALMVTSRRWRPILRGSAAWRDAKQARGSLCKIA